MDSAASGAGGTSNPQATKLGGENCNLPNSKNTDPRKKPLIQK